MLNGKGTAPKVVVIGGSLGGLFNAIALRSLGCEYGQGYYLGRPVPVDAMDLLLFEEGTERPTFLHDQPVSAVAGSPCMITLLLEKRDMPASKP